MKRKIPIIAGIVAAVAVIIVIIILALRSCGTSDRVAFNDLMAKSVAYFEDTDSEEAHNNIYNMVASGTYKQQLDLFSDGCYTEINESDYETYLNSTPSELDVKARDLNGIFVYVRALDAENVMLVQMFSFTDSDTPEELIEELNNRQQYLVAEYQDFGDICRFYNRAADDYSAIACEVDMFGAMLNSYNICYATENVLVSVTVLTNANGDDIVSGMDDYLDAIGCDNPHDKLGGSTSDAK